MMRRLMLLALLALDGCATDGSLARDMGPQDAIAMAAGLAPGGIPGTFLVHVTATGRQNGTIFLNSQADYRDQRNLTVAILPVAAGQLEYRLGRPADEALRGRTIRVDGIARRVTIYFTADGRPTDKYYYQTHVDVSRADQILSIS